MKQLLSITLLTGLVVATMTPQAFAGDPEKGMKTFKKCKACHSAEAGKNKVGPSLFGVFGRQAGIVTDYKYSKAMLAKAPEIVWNTESLDAWLMKPKKFIPKTKMGFPGLKKQKDRDNIIAYLMTLK